MAERIDELQLFIGSDASDAIRQLGNLAGTLDIAARSANNLSGATGKLNSFSRALSGVAHADFTTALANLKELSKLDFRKLRNKNVKIDLQANGVDNFNKAANILERVNSFNIKNTGVTQFSNSLRKLFGTDTSKFDVGVLDSMSTMVKDFSSMGGVNQSINKFVASIAKLAEAGSKTTDAANGLKILTPELTKTVNVMNNIGGVNPAINAFVGSLAKLASTGSKTTETANNLDDLAQAVVRFLNALTNSKAVNTNVAAIIYGLGNLASAGKKAGQAMTSVSNSINSSKNNGLVRTGVNITVDSLANALKKMFSISISLGAKAARSLGSFLAKLNLIPSASSGIDRTVLSFGNLLRAIIPFYGIRGVFNWGKEAFEAGSSIVELENVIDTAFGSLRKGYEDISGYVYDWAKGTIDAFGVSQIAAERYAGRLMSMFNSSGFDITEGMRDSAAKMSIDLIERAGDISSFYDITVDEAMTKMQSGLAGMTRPLRSLGVNMSVANLQAFALSQGITTSWQSMDQASQMALRYAYILDATKYAEGDFARTSLSAANQVRLLQLNVQQLSATLGQGLISVIAPVVSWLNALIRKLIQAAVAFRTFMWTLFGKPLQAVRGIMDETVGYLDDASGAASDLGSSAGGASDGLGGAGKAAKELKKQLTVLPFDELNQLAKDTNSAGSGGGGGGGGGGGIGGLGDMGLLPDFNYDVQGSDTVDAINRWAERIRNAFKNQQWASLGKIVAEGINAGFRFIYDVLDWEKLKPKIVDGFIVPFQTSFNSMMAWIDWNLVGQTLARGLNDITYTLRAWITGFQWRKYGIYFATGMNNLVSAIDADALGRLIADKFKMAWDMFGGWVKTFNFKALGSKLKIAVLGFLDELDWGDMGDSLAEFFNGISDAIITFFEGDDVAEKISESFSTFVNNFLKKFDSKKAEEAMKTVKDALKTALGDAIMNIDKSELLNDFVTLLSGLPWKVIGTLVGVKVGANLAAGIFGTAFKTAAYKAIMGIGSGASAGSAGASTASKLAIGTTDAAAGVSAGVAGASIMGALLEIGIMMRKFADEHGGVKQGANLDVDRSFGTNMTAPKSQNAAGTYSGVQTRAMDTPPSVAKATQVIETILTGIKDPSFLNLENAKASLMENPIVQKIMDGSLTKAFKTGYKKFTDTDPYTAIKKFGANISSTLTTWWKRYTDTKPYQAVKKFGANISATLSTWWKRYTDKGSYQAIKKFGASISDTLSSWWKKFTDRGSYPATKTLSAKDGGNFVNFTSTWQKLGNKTIELTVSLVKKVQDLSAVIQGKWQKLIDFVWNAKGGLFNGATAFQVFGEAGAEAAIPLERKSTMKRIASAIVESGGMQTSTNTGLAREIAMAIAPVVMDAINESNNRPLNVNATLYTENNEVLARAVNRGQRSLDKRYNPVSQFSY